MRGRRGSARRAASATFVSLTFAAIATHGCDRPTCDERATCPETDPGEAGVPVADGASPNVADGAPVGDTAAVVAVDARSDGAGGGSDGATGVDATGGDAAGSDAANDVTATGVDACGSIEDCTNDVDDDCNGLVDCADPACQPGFGCAGAPPAGWSGPVALFDGAGNPAPPPPACPSPFPSDVLDGTSNPIAAPATCGCTCGSPAGVTCGAVSVSFFFDNACNNLCAGPTAVAPGGACVTGCAGSQTIRALPPVAGGGSCTAHPAKTVPPIAWGETGRACAPAGPADSPGGCAGGLCAAKAPAPFLSSLCVWRSGDVTCPGGAYATKHLYFAGASDTRDCSGCGCDAPVGATCSSVDVSGYAAGLCPSNPAGQIASTGACVSAPSSTSIVSASASVASGGSCGTKPVTAIGSVTPTLPSTVCCGP